MEKLNDKWIRLIGIPAVELLTNLLYLDEYGYDWGVYARTSFWGIVYISLLWELITRWLCFARRRYPHMHQTRRRVAMTFAGYFVIVTAGQLTAVSLFAATGQAGVPITRDVYLQQLFGGYVAIVLVGAVYEIVYYFSKLKKAIIETESAKKAQLQHQFDSLKAQVNPHFLFNSLNSLGALIGENPRKASDFLDELSSVYRYLLQTNERELTTLRQELNFLRSYYHLLKTRHGTAITVHRQVDPAYLDAQLPPLTLQLLIENAVKHNVLLPEQPLLINVLTTESGDLVVANSIQRRTTRVPSNRVGLSNIAARYRLLGLREPRIEDDGRYFIVRLPLAVPQRAVLAAI